MHRRGFLGMAAARVAAAGSLPILARLADSPASDEAQEIAAEVGVVPGEAVAEFADATGFRGLAGPDFATAAHGFSLGGWEKIGDGQVFFDAEGEAVLAGAWVTDAGEVVASHLDATAWAEVPIGGAAQPLTRAGAALLDRIAPEFAR